MKYFYSVLASVTLALCAAAGVAHAQQPPAPPPDSQPYDDTRCGTWQNDVWVPNGNCTPDATRYRHDSVAGTITEVKGHLVTLQLSSRTLVVNDQPALDHQATGKVAVGRQVVAYGYWDSGTFYATSIY